MFLLEVRSIPAGCSFWFVLIAFSIPADQSFLLLICCFCWSLYISFLLILLLVHADLFGRSCCSLSIPAGRVFCSCWLHTWFPLADFTIPLGFMTFLLGSPLTHASLLRVGNGHQFTMDNALLGTKELASPEQTATGKDTSNPLMVARVDMVINPPWNLPFLGAKGLTSPEQTATAVTNSCCKDWKLLFFNVAACFVAAGYLVSAGTCFCCYSILLLREDLSRNLELTESKPIVPADSSSSIPADNVPAGSSSSIPADYVSAGHCEILTVEIDTLHADTEDKELLISELQDSLAAAESEIAILQIRAADTESRRVEDHEQIQKILAHLKL
ncbi:hypothetical protein Tco_0786881 [Tanacetum coccineum]